MIVLLSYFLLMHRSHSMRLRESVAMDARKARVARFSTTKYGRFLSVDPFKSSPPNVSIYNSVHVATRTQIPHKQ